MTPDIKSRSPYVGLIPYSDRDAEFFFGRETETDVISANLRAARLTVLYGSSGVGKSSVLQAGVVHGLRKIAKEDIKIYGQAGFAVVIHRKWAGNPIKDFAKAIHSAIADSLGIDPELLEKVPQTDDLTEILRAWSQRYNLELLIIFDQFEELFNYLAEKDCPGARFATQFAEVVKATDLPLRFLISLRGDTLSLLDYFKETIPGLLDNRLQLYHLNAEAAYRAITKPIRAYNDLYKPGPKCEIEPELIPEVLRQVPARINDSSVSQQAVGSSGEVAAQSAVSNEFAPNYFIETPYLQLVLKKIWSEEVKAGSHTLHLDTFKTKLRGAEQIIKSHLDEVMGTLDVKEQRIASECFEHLVTPMGTKVALTPAALSKLTKYDEEEIRSVLEVLIKGKPGKTEDPSADAKEAAGVTTDDEARILRTVEIPVGNKRLQGYEVTHDALTLAILDWRARYLVKHDAMNEYKALIRKVAPIAFGIAAVLLLAYGYVAYDASRARDKAVEKESTATDSLQIAEKKSGEIKMEAIEPYKDLCKVLINLADPSIVEKEAAIKELNELIERDKVPEGYDDAVIKLVAGIDKRKVEDLRKAAAEAKRQRVLAAANILPKVFFHITDESQRKPAQTYVSALTTDNKYIVPGIQLVDGLKLKNTQLRYFYTTDQNLAQNVADFLGAQGLDNIRVVYVSGYEDSTAIGPKHLELWFSNDAFPTDPSVGQLAK